MELEKTKLDGVFIIKPAIFQDNRGWFSETYSLDSLKKRGIEVFFVQDNHSFSAFKNTLRGLHLQKHPRSQTKLVRCTRGKVFDVAVDLRKNSPTYKEWLGVYLSEKNKDQILIPKGFAHGFLTLTEGTEVQYKVDEHYSPDLERTIKYDDPDLGISWGVENPILSEKDKNAAFLKDLEKEIIS